MRIRRAVRFWLEMRHIDDLAPGSPVPKDCRHKDLARSKHARGAQTRSAGWLLRYLGSVRAALDLEADGAQKAGFAEVGLSAVEQRAQGT